MASFLSAALEVNTHVDLSLGNLGQLSINVEGKCTKFTNVDGVALAKSVIEVGDESSPDDKHLTVNN